MGSDSFELDIFKAVPKLKGDSNYTRWKEKLELVCRSKGDDYWRCLTGVYQRPDQGEVYTVNRDRIKARLANDRGIEMDQITEDNVTAEVNERLQRNAQIRSDVQSGQSHWDKINFTILAMLQSTVESSPEGRITGLRDAHQAWTVLADSYDRNTGINTVTTVTSITELNYFGSEDHHKFCRKYQDLITKLRQQESNDVPTWFEYAMFYKAVNNPVTQNFINTVNLHCTDMSMDEIYTFFLQSETARKATSLAAYSTNQGSNHQQSNSGRGRGRGRGRGGSNNDSGHQQSNNQTIPRDSEDAGTIWCNYHENWGSHYSSACRLNPKNQNSDNQNNSNRGRGRGRGRGGPSRGRGGNNTQSGPSANMTGSSTPSDANSALVPASSAVQQQNQAKPSSSNATELHTGDDYDSLLTCNVNADLFVKTIKYDDADPTETENDLMMDSGTSHTMLKSKDLLTTFKPCRVPVTTATGDVFFTEGYGDLNITLANPDGHIIGYLTIPQTWWAPNLAHNLISIRQLGNLGYETIFSTDGSGRLTMNKQDPAAYLHSKKAHYYLTTANCATANHIQILKDNHLAYRSQELIAATAGKQDSSVSIEIAHRRLAHASDRKVQQSLPHLQGLKIQGGKKHSKQCTPCLAGKGHRLPLAKSRDITTEPGDIIHIDIWGPVSIPTYNHERYFATFTDDSTRYCWIFLLKTKDELLEKFKLLQSYLLQQLDVKIKAVHGDNAGEHQPLADHLAAEGITWDPTPSYAPYLNPVAEIKNRHLIEPLVTILTENQLPKFLWGHLLLAVAFIFNRLHHDKIHTSPYEALFGKVPDASRWRALGCKCWYLIPKDIRPTKLHPHMAEGRFIGYSENLYKIWDPSRHQIIKSRDVIFHEAPPANLPAPSYDLDLRNHPLSEDQQQEFLQGEQQRYVPTDFLHSGEPASSITPAPRRQPAPADNSVAPAAPSNFTMPHHRDDDPAWLVEYRETGKLPPIPSNDLISTPPANGNNAPAFQPTVQDESSEPTERAPAAPPSNLTPPAAPPASQPLRRSTRIKKPSTRLLESLQSMVVQAQADPDMSTSFLTIMANQPDAVSLEIMTSAVIDDPDPSPTGIVNISHKQAITGSNAHRWKPSIDKELRQHEINGTWKVIEKLKGMKTLPLRWVFRIKHDVSYKARLVCKGFKQRYGIDFHEVYAAVAKPMSFKIFVAIAARFGWVLHHFDVVGAFLNATVKELIYIDLPEGSQQPGKCGQLLKTLYGLKQSPREWLQLLTSVLRSLGFQPINADQSVFTFATESPDSDFKNLKILVYVDDLLVLAPTIEMTTKFGNLLAKQFEITDNGKCTHFLGIDLHYMDSGSIQLSQKGYIQKTLDRFGMTDSKPVATPFNAKEKLLPYDDMASPDDVKLYQEMIGSLIWLMVSTRPDIAYTVSKLASYSSNPSPEHLTAVKRVFRYLAGSQRLGLTYSATSATSATSEDDGKLIGYCDADWAGPHAEKSKSTSGYLFKLANGPISWSSKRQKSVALSSTESEYIAQAAAAQEALWLQFFLSELDIHCPDGTPIAIPKERQLFVEPIQINADNQGAIALSKSEDFHARSKHISIKYHFLRQHVKDQNIRFSYIPTVKQAADGFTKPLEKTAHRRFIDNLGMSNG